MIAGLGATVAAAACVVSYWPVIWARAQREWLFRQMSWYTYPSNTVVYTMDMREGTQLLGHSSEYRLHHGAFNYVDKVTFRPAVLDRYIYRPTASSVSSDAVAFLHERRSRRGASRVIGIELTASADCIVLDAWAGGRRTGSLAPAGSPSTHTLPPPLVLHEGDIVRVFGGSVDPADESRFSIPLEVNGVRNTLSGRLRDDKTVQLWPDTGRLVHLRGKLDGAWCPDGSNREPSGLDRPVRDDPRAFQ